MVTVVYMAFATRARWAAEDEAKKPKVTVGISQDVYADRFRQIRVGLEPRPSDPVWISMIEIVEPPGSTVARPNDEPARRLEFRPNEMSWPTNGSYFWVHTPATPKSDQGTKIMVHVVFHVEASPRYDIDRRVPWFITANAASE